MVRNRVQNSSVDSFVFWNTNTHIDSYIYVASSTVILSACYIIFLRFLLRGRTMRAHELLKKYNRMIAYQIVLLILMGLAVFSPLMLLCLLPVFLVFLVFFIVLLTNSVTYFENYSYPQCALKSRNIKVMCILMLVNLVFMISIPFWSMEIRWEYMVCALLSFVTEIGIGVYCFLYFCAIREVIKQITENDKESDSHMKNPVNVADDSLRQIPDENEEYTVKLGIFGNLVLHVILVILVLLVLMAPVGYFAYMIYGITRP